jgi:hypothetical protein
MKLGRARSAAALVAGALVLVAGSAGAANAGVSVRVDRQRVETQLGHRFVFRTTIANRGAASSEAVVAHLNVLSLRRGVYVDPEDWSSDRTRYLRPIPAGGSTTITWKLQAVNPGEFAAYVAVLPQKGPARPPTASAVVQVAVADRKTINSGGILPLALGVPAALGLLAGGVRRARRSG